MSGIVPAIPQEFAAASTGPKIVQPLMRDPYGTDRMQG